MNARKAWYRRVWLWAILGLLLLVVAVRIALNPIARHFTRVELDQIEGIEADFKDVSVGVFPPSYTITHLKFKDEHAPRSEPPIFYVERVKTTLSLGDLLHGRIVGYVIVEKPKLTVIAKPSAPTPKKASKKLFNPQAEMANITPLRVDRVAILGGELHFIDMTDGGQPDLWIHDTDIAVENLATRRNLSKSQPATLALSGTVQQTGQLSAFISLDLLKSSPTFAGRAELKGLQLSDLHQFLVTKAGVKAPNSQLDVFASFEASKGLITGGVKPVLKYPQIQPAKSDFGTKFKAKLADQALKLFSDRIPGRNAVATVIPIQGRIDDPQPQIWPLVFEVIRNAFVEGMAEGFAYTPPPPAPEKESVLKQAGHALRRDSGPPRTQPLSKEARK